MPKKDEALKMKNCAGWKRKGLDRVWNGWKCMVGIMSILMGSTRAIRCHRGDKAEMERDWAFGNLKW